MRKYGSLKQEEEVVVVVDDCDDDNLLEIVFSKAISDIARMGGDADTNACVAGGLLGCYFGFKQGLPDRWLREMPYEIWLEAWVQKLIFMIDKSTPDAAR